MKKRIAHLTSNVLNPFLLCMAVIMLLSFISSSSMLDALKWSFISIILSVLPVFLFLLYMVKNDKIDTFFANIREQRTKIYLSAGFFSLVNGIVLFYLQAPMILIMAFIAGFSTALIYMLINLWWKISLHTALVAASVTVLVMLYGWIAVAAVALVPLTAWARIELEYHTLTQTAVGALLAALIVLGVFYPLILA
ncbi:phosphatidic acid phosphatase [Chloroflexota bacterium]